MKNNLNSNIALVSKLMWKMISGDGAVWASTFRAKYCHSDRFWDVSKTSSDSFAWRGILETRQFMTKGCVEVVGDGSSIEIWSRPWVLWLLSGVPRASFDHN